MRAFPRCLTLAAALAACGGSPQGTPAPVTRAVLPHDVAGCYALAAGVHREFGAPRIRLDTAVVSGQIRPAGRDAAWTVARLDAEGRTIPQEGTWPILYWRPHPADSVRILIGNGYGGMELFVAARARGDTLPGRALKLTDYSPPIDAGPSHITRIPCISPPNPPSPRM